MRGKSAKFFTMISLPLLILPTIFFSSEIFQQLLTKSSQLIKWIFFIVHFVEYGFLSLIIYLVLIIGLFLKKEKAAIISYIVCVLIATTEEILQIQRGLKTGSVVDLLVASAGSFLATMIIELKLKKNESKLRNKNSKRTRKNSKDTCSFTKTKR